MQEYSHSYCKRDFSASFRKYTAVLFTFKYHHQGESPSFQNLLLKLPMQTPHLCMWMNWVLLYIIVQLSNRYDVHLFLKCHVIFNCFLNNSHENVVHPYSKKKKKSIRKNRYSNENLRLTEFQEMMHHWLPGLTTGTKLVLKTAHELRQVSCCQKRKRMRGNKKTASCQTCHLKKGRSNLFTSL